MKLNGVVSGWSSNAAESERLSRESGVNSPNSQGFCIRAPHARTISPIVACSEMEMSQFG